MTKGRAGRRAGPGAVLAALAALAVGCAEPGPPPGGPVDESTPEVLAAFPEPGAVRVPPDAALRIGFGKKIDQSTVERALWITPGGAGKLSVDVDGAALVVTPGRPFPEDVTVGVLLTTAIRDRKREGRQNPMAEPYRWVFSTGDSLWPGRIHGRVVREGSAGDGLIMVGVYPGEADTVPDPALVEPMAITQARRDGTFALEGLPVDSRRWWLLSMLDRDGDREIRGQGEFVSYRADTLRLVPGGLDTARVVQLVDPMAPGEVNGILERAAGDSIDVWLEALEDLPEGAISPSARARAAPNGEFSLRRMAPGSYRVQAFCDGNRNGARDAEEPVRDLFTVTVTPGETVDTGRAAFAPCGP